MVTYPKSHNYISPGIQLRTKFLKIHALAYDLIWKQGHHRHSQGKVDPE